MKEGTFAHYSAGPSDVSAAAVMKEETTENEFIREASEPLTINEAMCGTQTLSASARRTC